MSGNSKYHIVSKSRVGQVSILSNLEKRVAIEAGWALIPYRPGGIYHVNDSDIEEVHIITPNGTYRLGSFGLPEDLFRPTEPTNPQEPESSPD